MCKKRQEPFWRPQIFSNVKFFQKCKPDQSRIFIHSSQPITKVFDSCVCNLVFCIAKKCICIKKLAIAKKNKKNSTAKHELEKISMFEFFNNNTNTFITDAAVFFEKKINIEKEKTKTQNTKHNLTSSKWSQS